MGLAESRDWTGVAASAAGMLHQVLVGQGRMAHLA